MANSNVEVIGPDHPNDVPITIHSDQNGPPLDMEDDPIVYEEKGCCRCCFGPFANLPCGWPKGSCTATMTIISVIFFLLGLVAVTVYGFMTWNTNVILSVMGINASGFSFAFGHYVGNRSTTNDQIKSTDPSPAPAPVLQGRRMYRQVR